MESNIKNQEYLPKIGKKVGFLVVPPLIVGDAAFLLQSWLMKPCTNANPTLQQRYYNYRLSRARMMTEGAFGQLKGRWRVLLRRCECSQENTNKAALACVVLHNICLEKGDTIIITREMDLAIDPKTGNTRDRATIRELLQVRACDKIPDTDTRTPLIREGLIEKLWLELVIIILIRECVRVHVIISDT